MSVMESVTLALVGIGWLVMFVGGIRLLVAAFRISVLWGFAVLFIPLAAFVFIFKYWEEARSPFLNQLAGMAVFFGGGVLMTYSFFQDANSLMKRIVKDPQVDPRVLATEHMGGLGRIMADVAEAVPTPAGRPPPADFVGRSLEELKQVYGKPQGELLTGNRVVLRYAQFMAMSDDGRIISSVHPVDESKPSATPAAPAKKSGPAPARRRR